jgi:hypothetical protein
VTRTCASCRQPKPLTAFSPQPNARGAKLHAYCKPCNTARVMRVQGTPAGRLARRDRELRRKFGVTLEQFNAMAEAQGGRCAVCRDLPGGRRASLFVDHDHATGAVRGLLCNRCNTGIGHLQDCADLLERAAGYLRSYEKSNRESPCRATRVA